MSIYIDKEFESLIPPLSADEFKQLEENCCRDGIRDPLILWPQEDGNNILIDGHNRWRIAAKHGGMSFTTKCMDFKNRDEAIIWIVDNQLGRRNLHTLDRVTLEDKKREIIAQIAKKNSLANLKQNVTEAKKSCPREPLSRNERRANSTDYKIAKAAGTSEDTVRKVRRINEQAPESTKKAVREGKLSINQAYNSTFPKREDPVKAAKREHLEYELSKGDIVDIKAARKDRVNQEIISGAMVQEVMKLLGTIQKFSLYYNAKDLSVLRTELDDANKTHMKGIIKNCHMTLDGIARAIDGGKHGKI